MLWRILKRSIFPAELLEQGIVIAFRQQHWLICWVLLKTKAETSNVLTTEEQRCLDTKMQLLDIIKKKVDNNRVSRPKEEKQQVKTQEVMQKEEEEEEDEEEKNGQYVHQNEHVIVSDNHVRCILKKLDANPNDWWQCNERKYACIAKKWGRHSSHYYYYCDVCHHMACPACALLLAQKKRDDDW